MKSRATRRVPRQAHRGTVTYRPWRQIGIMAPPILFSGPYGGKEEVSEPLPANFNRERRISVSAESLSSALEKDDKLPETIVPKTEKQKERILEALSRQTLFQSLEREQKEAVLAAMQEVTCRAGDIVIKQGDDGNFCYVVEQGTLDVYVQPPGTLPEDAFAAPMDKLGTKVVSYSPGAIFGELALLYLQPRAASVVATSDCTMWALDRVTFRKIIAVKNQDRRILLDSFLQQVPLLQHLRSVERHRIVDAIEVVEYNAGEVIFREGDVGTRFYLVINGVAEVLKSNSTEVLSYLQRGDYFGELALLRSAPRAATIVASGKSSHGRLRLAALDEASFTRLLGPLTDIMARYAETHYGHIIDQPLNLSTAPANEPGSPRSQS